MGGAILNLKRWVEVEYKAGPEAKITMELRRLKRLEARPLQRALLAVMGGIDEVRGSKDLSSLEQAKALAALFDSLQEEQVVEWFAKAVRNVQGLYIDGETITTGPGLLDDADDGLVLFVLMKLADLSRLSPQEGKASASPSTSSSAAETDASASPAGSTESGAGPTPSTATGTPGAA